jgi:hypothetical protein
MDGNVLGKLFGREQKWQGPCTVILGAEAALKVHGSDSIVAGGVKMYAPRTVSGRINADAVCLLQDNSALLIIQQQKFRQDTGEESVKQSLLVADPGQIAALEFLDTASLAALGLSAPALRTGPSSFCHQGIYQKPISQWRTCACAGPKQ